jgi:ABC-type phosphate/phosphonate transport system substrate-binding protein
VRTDSPITEVAQLEGRTVATGAIDSPQATLLPLAHLARIGLEPGKSFAVRRFDVMVTKHGDHVGGERDAVKALLSGEVDAACVIDGNQLAFAKEGTIPAGGVRVLTRTAPYDHCTMTVFDDVEAGTVERFRDLLLSMSYDDPVVRPLLQLEGLKAWRVGRTSGYVQLEEAVDRLRFYGADGAILAEGYPG